MHGGEEINRQNKPERLYSKNVTLFLSILYTYCFLCFTLSVYLNLKNKYYSYSQETYCE